MVSSSKKLQLLLGRGFQNFLCGQEFRENWLNLAVRFNLNCTRKKEKFSNYRDEGAQ